MIFDKLFRTIEDFGNLLTGAEFFDEQVITRIIRKGSSCGSAQAGRLILLRMAIIQRMAIVQYVDPAYKRTEKII